MTRPRALLTTLTTLLPTLVAAVLLAGAGPAPASAAASPSAIIGSPQPERAPFGAPGGLVSPYVVCAKPTQRPRVQWTVNNVATGQQQTYSWSGAVPAAKFPRVDPGAYASTTVATCKGRQTTRTETVVVTRKTRRTTVSHAEFHRIARGMSLKKVDRIVGYTGRSSWPVGRRREAVAYDMNRFWSWASVTFRHGHVVAKHWDVAHD